MVMKFDRAYCEQIAEALTPYQARELYTDEDGDYYGRELTFLCEDPGCRVRVTPVGIYMARKSKRALHFRSRDEHKPGCGFLSPGDGNGKSRKPAEDEDDYKPTNFPTELDLNPRKRKGSGGGDSLVDLGGEGGGTDGNGNGITGGERRKTSTRTRYLDFVVDCFLSGDDESKKERFTIAGKTMAFFRFFKKVQYFVSVG